MEENELEENKKTPTYLYLGVLLVALLILFVGFYSKRQKLADSQQNSEQAEVMGDETTNLLPTQSEFEVEGGMYYFKPNELRVKSGDKVKVTFSSADGFHDFVIDGVTKSERVSTGGKTVVEFVAPEPGEYQIYCSVGNHKEMGMVGKLMIE